MITLKQLRWSNCFSYAEDNYLNLSENAITQLIGPNGAGKTSIPLIIQEALYGKNIKGIKKQDITNRNTNRNGYNIELDFSKNEDEYTIVLDRKSSLKLKLLKNGVDISSHTSINTYKTIADIIGIEDFKTFIQLIYQSSTDSLEFLTATDTNRKRFLISLLQLNKYVEFHELFKEKAKEIHDTIKELNGSVNNIQSWIEKHEAIDKTEKEEKEVPEFKNEWVDQLADLKNQLNSIKSINNKINSNNEYIRLFKELDHSILTDSVESFNPSELKEVDRKKAEIGGNIKAPQLMITKLKKLSDKCPTCFQEIDEEHTQRLLQEYEKEIEELLQLDKQLSERRSELSLIQDKYNKRNKVQAEFEKLSLLIDHNIPTSPFNKGDLETDIQELTNQVNKTKQQINDIVTYNVQASAHNSKIKVVLEQLEEFKTSLGEKLEILGKHEELHRIVEFLKTTFSTNGLISYKIESSVKELEKVINEYLSELSYFQIYFKLSGDKLNIEVLDASGNSTGVESLSTGERARVNLSTILAIRKIMSSLTSTKINFLFLDEIVGTVDDEGKERFAEILLEENLNTFMVSHGWVHPLIHQVRIHKENGVSIIEHD